MRRRLHITLTGLAAMLAFTGTARAAAITVNTITDASAAGSCSLRDAITASNSVAAVNGCSAGTGTDIINFSVSGTIVLNAALPYIQSALTVDGSGQSITISGNNAALVFAATGEALTLRYLTIINGNGFYLGNVPAGAVYFGSSGNLNIDHCTFSANATAWNPTNIRPASASSGAVVSLGPATITNSTFTGNGSTVAVGGALALSSDSTISNSTFAGNTGYGGAVAQYSFIAGGSAGLSVVNSTFNGNSAALVGYGADIQIFNFAHLNIGNTILAGSLLGADCVNNGGYAITVTGTNLVTDNSCAISGALTVPPILGPLANNGGPTQTIALMNGSPAISAGSLALCTTAPVNSLDQRGMPRPGAGKSTCDIGAYEYQETVFPFTGFFAPVANADVNIVKAGQAVPINFSLGSNLGLNIFAAGYPVVQQSACLSGLTQSTVETVTAGASSLSYNATSNTYTYVWKTSSAWAGTCGQFVMRLTDGTFHMANFQFK
jgi:hypothetical protein